MPTDAADPVDYAPLFAAYERVQAEKQRKVAEFTTSRNALQAFLFSAGEAKSGSGFQRMTRCR